MKRPIITGVMVTAFCITLLAIISIINVNNIAIANSSASPSTIDVNYQVVIPGENDNRPVSDVKVTLVIIGFDNNTDSIRVLGKADVPNNPLLSSNGIIDGGSAYVFPNVPAPPINTDEWIYAVKTERNGRTWIESGPFYGAIHTSTSSFDDGHSFAIPSDASNGTLYGYVILNDGNYSLFEQRLYGVGVKVTLYSCLPYDKSRGIVNTGIVDIPNNPQVSDQDSMYRFDGLTPGFYNITIEKDGLVGHKVINFTSDEDNNNWIFNNEVLLQPAPPRPAETPTLQATITVTPVTSQSIGPSPSPQLPVSSPTPTAQTTAIPASTNGFQFIIAIVSLAIAYSALFHMVRNK